MKSQRKFEIRELLPMGNGWELQGPVNHAGQGKVTKYTLLDRREVREFSTAGEALRFVKDECSKLSEIQNVSTVAEISWFPATNFGACIVKALQVQ